MRQVTWVNRLTDESNPWFHALRLEDAGEYNDSIISYLKDSGENLQRGELMRAALSCSCAASCLEKLDVQNYARKLYREAAAIYWENGMEAIGKSLREAFWSLREAYKCFLNAQEDAKAKEIHSIVASLANKVNPFVGKIEMIPTTEGNGSPRSQNVENSMVRILDSKVLRAIEDFMEVAKSERRTQTSPLDVEPVDSEDDYLDETRIISKLG